MAGEGTAGLLLLRGRRARQAAASQIGPDLILLDVDLPGVDGFEVCKRLKADAHTADIPVVFLTGAASTDEKLRGLAMGATDYVTKPFDPAELCARVRSSLHTKNLIDLLAQKEERFRILAENSSDVISRQSLNGTFMYVSPASIAILGYAPEEMVGMNLSAFVHPEDKAALENVIAARPTSAKPVRSNSAFADRTANMYGSNRPAGAFCTPAGTSPGEFQASRATLPRASRWNIARRCVPRRWK